MAIRALLQKMLKLKIGGSGVDSSVFLNFERFVHLTRSLEPFELWEWSGLHIIPCLSPRVPLGSTVLCVCDCFCVGIPQGPASSELQNVCFLFFRTFFDGGMYLASWEIAKSPQKGATRVQICKKQI